MFGEKLELSKDQDTKMFKMWIFISGAYEPGFLLHSRNNRQETTLTTWKSCTVQKLQARKPLEGSMGEIHSSPVSSLPNVGLL